MQCNCLVTSSPDNRSGSNLPTPDTAQFLAIPAFINTINADTDVSLALHVGDTHSGKEYCTYAYNLGIFNQWKAFKVPLVYTPGDNEWADCHKIKEGGGTYNATTKQIDYALDANKQWLDYAGGDPLANLQLVRSLFFSSPGKTQGSGTMAVHTQAQEFDANYPADSSHQAKIT